MGEIQEAVDTIRAEGNDQIVIMQCTLNYPTDDTDANLNVLKTFQSVFPNHIIGLSDHTLGTLPPVVASSMGAKVIEKHFTVDKTLPDSADHWLSVDPSELATIVYGIRHVDMLKGTHEKYVLPCEATTRQYDKRSIVSKKEIKARLGRSPDHADALILSFAQTPDDAPAVVGPALDAE